VHRVLAGAHRPSTVPSNTAPARVSQKSGTHIAPPGG
jgi:hypothetical protein